MVTANEAGVAPYTNSTLTVVQKQSTNGFDNVPNFRMSLANSNKSSKCQLLLPQRCIKFTQNRKENLWTFKRSRSSYNWLRYERLSPSSTNKTSLTGMTKQSKSRHHHSAKGAAERATAFPALAKNWRQRAPRHIPLWMRIAVHKTDRRRSERRE